MPEKIRRADIWFARLTKGVGHETHGARPVVVLSVDAFNNGPSGLVVVAPLTTREKGIPFHVALAAPDGGVVQNSYIKCEEVRSISRDRLFQRLGSISSQALSDIEDRLRILLLL